MKLGYAPIFLFIRQALGGLYWMLVLGRKPGEYIVIDDKIKVAVIRSEEGNLRLAIDAPREIKIVRGEVYESMSK